METIRHRLVIYSWLLLVILERNLLWFDRPEYQPSAAIKIKDGGHNFRSQNTEHSLAKITPTLQAKSYPVENPQISS